MSQAGETFFTAIGCMDGRVQEPIRDFGRRKFDAEHADTITEPGLVGQLAAGPDQSFLDGLKRKVDISLVHHHSQGIVIFGHQECAGNPVEDDRHRDDVRKSVDVVKTLLPHSLPIVGAFVKRGEIGWEVEELDV